ncbi:MAG: hypothetical protein WD278_00400 [Pirellulales bacterium]
MTDAPHPIWTAMERAVAAAPGEEDALLGADLGLRPLSPWAFWLLIGLVRQRVRQDWAFGVLRDRLGISVADMGSPGKWRIERKSGVVPGLIEWAYEVGGSVFQLTHRMSGEAIRVGLYEETGKAICSRDCGVYLASLRAPEPPERRLLELHPSRYTMRLVERELRRAGLLLPLHNDREAWILPPQVVDRFELVSAFCQAWSDDARRPGGALAVGDWMAAAPMMSDSSSELRDRLDAEMRACQRRRLRMLLNRLGSKNLGGTALIGLAELDVRYGDAALGEALAGDREDLAQRAVSIIGDRENAAAWCPLVCRRFKRLDPNRSGVQAEDWRVCAQILLRHGYRKREVLKRLSRAKRFDLGEIALLALSYDPRRAPPLFRRALRAKGFLERPAAPAILAILDEDWSRRLMLAVINESDLRAAAACSSALSFSADPSVRRAAEEWEQQHGSSPESKDWFVYLLDKDLDEVMRNTIADYHDRVLPLRGRIT